MGALGRPGRRRTPGRRPWRPPKPDRPPLSAILQAGCEAVRVWQARVEPRRRVENPAGVEAGRPAGAIAPERQEVRRGPERVADGEAEVAQRGCVGVEAQDLGGSRGALQREAGAQRAGGGRIGAEKGVEQGEPGAGGKQRIALPCPSAGPRPGRDRRRRRKGLPFRGFRRGSSWLARASRAAQKRTPRGSGGASASSSSSARITWAWWVLGGALSPCGAESAPLVVGWRCPISLPYQTLI